MFAALGRFHLLFAFHLKSSFFDFFFATLHVWIHCLERALDDLLGGWYCVLSSSAYDKFSDSVSSFSSKISGYSLELSDSVISSSVSHPLPNQSRFHCPNPPIRHCFGYLECCRRNPCFFPQKDNFCSKTIYKRYYYCTMQLLCNTSTNANRHEKYISFHEYPMHTHVYINEKIVPNQADTSILNLDYLIIFFCHPTFHFNPNLGGGGDFTPPPVGFPLITQKR